ncbi:hypothetical protein H4S08_001232 [Coemansia sp. RSA 1365]|nr:hypothetical protein H4S08_001232 [Coemansia sp. RSA 1365]
MADPIMQSKSTSKGLHCDANGHCYYMRKAWTHIVWSSILVTSLILVCLWLLIRHRRRQLRHNCRRYSYNSQRQHIQSSSDNKKVQHYIVDLEDQYYEPAPRYTPKYHDLVASPQEFRFKLSVTPDPKLTAPEAAACRDSSAWLPPPYTDRSQSEGTTRNV